MLRGIARLSRCASNRLRCGTFATSSEPTSSRLPASTSFRATTGRARRAFSRRFTSSARRESFRTASPANRRPLGEYASVRASVARRQRHPRADRSVSRAGRASHVAGQAAPELGELRDRIAGGRIPSGRDGALVGAGIQASHAARSHCALRRRDIDGSSAEVHGRARVLVSARSRCAAPKRAELEAFERSWPSTARR